MSWQERLLWDEDARPVAQVERVDGYELRVRWLGDARPEWGDGIMIAYDRNEGEMRGGPRSGMVLVQKIGESSLVADAYGGMWRAAIPAITDNDYVYVVPRRRILGRFGEPCPMCNGTGYRA